MGDPRVVFVDSDSGTLKTISRILHGRPYECALFDNAADALTYLQQHTVDLVASELNLPEVDGLALLRHVEHRCPDTVRVVLVAAEDRETLLSAIAAGLVQRYVPKPCSGVELLSVVEQSVSLCLLRNRYAQLTREQVQRGVAAGCGRAERQFSLAQALRLPVRSIGAAVLLASVQLRDEDPMHDELKRCLDTVLESAAVLQKLIVEITTHPQEAALFSGRCVDPYRIMETRNGLS
ncbi:MAG: response regulator [Spirochaetaceae bacterium]|nr:MAG: response regulator [Spirochaetaceae bacterium]